MMSFKFIISFVLFILGSLGQPLWAATVNVVFPTENTVTAERIILGQVASVVAASPAGENLAETIKKIDLGPAPPVGQNLVLRQGQLEQRILASKINMADASFEIPAEVTFSSSSQIINEKTLEKIVLEYLAQNEPYQSGHFELLSLSTAGKVNLPPGQLTYRFVPQNSSNPTYLSGYVYFNIDGKDVSRVRLTAQVDLSVTALVAARALPRGHVIADVDVSLTQVPYAQGKGALTDPEVAVGSTSRTNILQGEAIKDRHLTKSIMVRRGDTVTIIAQNGPLRVSASGVSKQDGALGDTISVINQDSKKTVAGKVIAPGQVEIIF